MNLPTLQHEQRLWRSGYSQVAGIDEAGRGALAGPVVAATAVFSQEGAKKLLKKVRDSKQLTELARERLYDTLTTTALAWEVGIISHRVIDRINIANASLHAMRGAVWKLAVPPAYLLLDGYFPSDALRKKFKGIAAPRNCIVGGDASVFSIAAASVIAKVTRDRIMRAMHDKYPLYGFSEHKGYGTAYHYKMLREHGPCTIHRKSFFLG